MRSFLVLGVLALFAMGSTPSGLSRQPPEGVPPLPQTTNGIPNQGGGGMAPTEVDLIKWGATQGGFLLIIILGGLSYRRDFFRKISTQQADLDAIREEKRMLAAIVRENTEAATRQTVAIESNTNATNRLATSVDRLEDRRRNTP
jgi:hypothetical protein